MSDVPTISAIFTDGSAQEQPFHPSSRLFSPRMPVPTFVSAELRGAITKQEQPFHPSSKFVPSKITQPTFISAELRGLVTRQEQPFHPLSRLLSAKTTEIILSSELRGLIVKQEYPYHPPSRLLSAIAVTNLDAPTINAIFVDAEQPDHARSKLSPSASPVAAAALTTTRTILTKQRRPDHPAPRLFSNSVYVPPPQVRLLFNVIFTEAEQPPSYKPIMAFSRKITNPGVLLNAVFVDAEQPPIFKPIIGPARLTQPVFLSPERRGIQVKQELPYHPPSRFNIAVVPGNAAPPSAIGAVKTRQEYPYHPPSKFTSAVIVSNIASPPQIGAVKITQEYPWHPWPKFTSAVIVGNVASPSEIGKLRIFQQLPPQPLPILVPSRVSTPLVPPVGKLATKQEAPFHPLSKLWFGLPPTTFGTTSPELRRLFVRQELPYHPQSSFTGAVIPGNIASPTEIGKIATFQQLPPQPLPVLIPSRVLNPPVQSSGLITKQELPNQPPSIFSQSIFVGNVADLPQVGSFVIRQEYPYHPPSKFTLAVVPGNLASPSETGIVRIKQEYPYHPQSQFTLAVVPGNAANPSEVGKIVTFQQLPPQPLPILVPSFTKVEVGPTGKLLLTVQQFPGHPPSKLWPALIPGDIAALPQVGSFVVKQERPGHPTSQFWAYPPLALITESVGHLLTVQEYPYHPKAQFWTYVHPLVGPSPNLARILANTKVRVRVLANKTPRTIRYN